VMRTLIPGVTIKGLPCVIVRHEHGWGENYYVSNGRKNNHGRAWLELERGFWTHERPARPETVWYLPSENEVLEAVAKFADYVDMPEYDQHDQDESIIDQGGLNDTTEGTGNTGRDDLPDPGSEREPQLSHELSPKRTAISTIERS